MKAHPLYKKEEEEPVPPEAGWHSGTLICAKGEVPDDKESRTCLDLKIQMSRSTR